MGESRSATLLAAYLLFRTPTLTPQTALSLIRQTQPSVEPNASFLAQLELYHTMQCPPFPTTHPIYERWLYTRHVEASRAAGTAPAHIRFSDETPSPKTAVSPSATLEAAPLTVSSFRCRRCRTPLATSPYLVPHKAVAAVATPCAHIFLEPLAWMRPELDRGELEGRLECPNGKCGANVGKYAWQGMKCSCGEWIVPAICIARGRIDEVRGR